MGYLTEETQLLTYHTYSLQYIQCLRVFGDPATPIYFARIQMLPGV